MPNLITIEARDPVTPGNYVRCSVQSEEVAQRIASEWREQLVGMTVLIVRDGK